MDNLLRQNWEEIPEIEYEEEDKCMCEDCELQREIRSLRSSLLFLLALPKTNVYSCSNFNNCPVCGNNRRYAGDPPDIADLTCIDCGI